MTFSDSFRGQILWDTGTAFSSTYYASEEYNYEQNNPKVDSNYSMLTSITGSIQFLVDIEGGRWKIVNNQMIFYKSDNSTEIMRFDLFDENGSPTIDGVDSSPITTRLVCESDDVSYMFKGMHSKTDDDGIVSFNLPPMKSKLKEGTYTAKIEVLIENRYFAPVKFNINFKKTMKVVAESIQVVKRHVEPTVSVSNVQIVKKNSANTSQTLKEKHESKKYEIDVLDENKIRELARKLIKASK